jgi:hypothetical protein
MRADIHHGPEQRLHKQAGYISARPTSPSPKPLATHRRSIHWGQKPTSRQSMRMSALGSKADILSSSRQDRPAESDRRARARAPRRPSHRGARRTPGGWGSGQNKRVNPMPQWLREARRCGARTRNGTPCKGMAMPNGRCRMHGGGSPGAPKGNRNAWKHGYYSEESTLMRRAIRALLSSAREAVELR